VALNNYFLHKRKTILVNAVNFQLNYDASCTEYYIFAKLKFRMRFDLSCNSRADNQPLRNLQAVLSGYIFPDVFNKGDVGKVNAMYSLQPFHAIATSLCWQSFKCEMTPISVSQKHGYDNQYSIYHMKSSGSSSLPIAQLVLVCWLLLPSFLV